MAEIASTDLRFSSLEVYFPIMAITQSGKSATFCQLLCAESFLSLDGRKEEIFNGTFPTLQPQTSRE